MWRFLQRARAARRSNKSAAQTPNGEGSGRGLAAAQSPPSAHRLAQQSGVEGSLVAAEFESRPTVFFLATFACATARIDAEKRCQGRCAGAFRTSRSPIDGSRAACRVSGHWSMPCAFCAVVLQTWRSCIASTKRMHCQTDVPATPPSQLRSHSEHHRRSAAPVSRVHLRKPMHQRSP